MRLFLIVHVALSLAGILAGLVEVFGWVTRRSSDRWRAIVIWTSVAASVSGYGLPATQMLPSHIVGAFSLVTLALVVFAVYRRRLAGGWRTTYVVAAAVALYLNLFVGVVQAFLKIPALTALAPRQSEPPFAVAQGVLFLLFLGAAASGVISGRPGTSTGLAKPIAS